MPRRAWRGFWALTVTLVHVPHPGFSPQENLTYWLLRLSESLHRLNEGLLWAGSSPGEFGQLMSAPEFKASPMAMDVAHASRAMRRFSDLMFVSDPDSQRTDDRSIWEDLMLALRVLLAACAEHSELWIAGEDGETLNPVLTKELRNTVYAVERLCGHFERVH